MHPLPAPPSPKVQKEDQARINAFSRLNLRYDELDEEITKNARAPWTKG